MADFALWATACERAFWPAASFLNAYKATRRAAVEDVVEADPVAARILDMMAARPMWTGNASESCAPLRKMTFRQADQKLPGRWPAACVAPRPPLRAMEFELLSVVRDDRGRGSSG